MNTINRFISPYNFSTGNTSRIKYIVMHYVGALGGAKDNCSFYAGGNRGASAHFFVGFNGEIWQSVEEANIAWHCGANSYKHPTCRNANSIGIEMCVRKNNTNHLGAEDQDWYFENSTVDSAIELTKHLMKKYNVPAENVIRHYDVTGKICPNPYVYNRTHTWTDFKKRIGGSIVDTSKLYRVRKSWNDVKSQTGAYKILDNAISECAIDYSVFDWNGKSVYSNNGSVIPPTADDSKKLESMNEQEFIEYIGSLATKDMTSSNILASITVAQAILESGYGKTELALKALNLFGMKESLSGNNWNSKWDGTIYTKKTQEQDSLGNITTITANFRKYKTILDSLNDHSAYLSGAKNGNNLRYAGLIGEKSYLTAITIIKNGGYATDVKYIDKICDLIKRYNLTKFDIITSIKPDKPIIPPVDNSNLYRVRKSWNDIKSQLGAYEDLNNAIDCAKKTKGYSVFDGKGKSVYTPSNNPTFSPYTVKITADVLNVRSSPSTSSKITATVKMNEVYTIVEEQNGWGKLKSGLGWISLEYTKRI